MNKPLTDTRALTQTGRSWRASWPPVPTESRTYIILRSESVRKSAIKRSGLICAQHPKGVSRNGVLTTSRTGSPARQRCGLPPNSSSRMPIAFRNGGKVGKVLLVLTGAVEWSMEIMTALVTRVSSSTRPMVCECRRVFLTEWVKRYVKRTYQGLQVEQNQSLRPA
jgi:hypothetical protein